MVEVVKLYICDLIKINIKMNFKLLMSVAIILTLFACNASKKVELTKEETKEVNTSKPADSFEGKVYYDFTMKDKSGEMPEEAVKMMFGSEQVYTQKGNKYINEFGGQMKMKQYYLGGDSMFMQMLGVEGLLWNDVGENTDELISMDITENAAKVMGINCDLLTIKSKEGTAQYYYSKDYPINPEGYKNHKYDFWDMYVEKAKAIPLKAIADSEEFYIEATATKIEPMKIDESEFDLPNLPRVKNPEP